MKKTIISVIVILCFVTTAYAGSKDLDASNITSQGELKDVVREVGHIISIPSMVPADPLGMLPGVDIGVEASVYELDKTRIFLDVDNFFLTRVHFMKGLPSRFDFGIEFSRANESNIRALGAELRWAAVEDDLLTPAIGFRAAYSEMAGVTDFNLRTYSFDAQLSKELVFLTPYVGVGYLSSKGKTTGYGLKSEEEISSNVYTGLKLSFVVFNITAQADFSENTMYTLKLGLDF